MKKHILLIATLTALCAVCFADETQYIATAQTPSQASGASNTPHVIKTVRSALGREIDALGQKLVEFQTADVLIYNALTNLAARVEKLEAAEAERQAAREAAQKRAAERKAKRADTATARDTLQNVIKRGKKAATKEGK